MQNNANEGEKRESQRRNTRIKAKNRESQTGNYANKREKREIQMRNNLKVKGEKT